MCLFSIVFQVVPDIPLLVFSNREESRTRPTDLPQIWDTANGKPAWLGGRDRQAGGTWLGVNTSGLVVAVTNRPQQKAPQQPRSRGLLCRDLLQCVDTEHAREKALRELATHQFVGCNLVILDRRQAVVIEVADETQTSVLSTGLHVITNGPLNDPHDARLLRARGELQRLLDCAPDLPDWIHEGKRTCGLHAITGLPAICLHGDEWGTVSSTVLALTTEPQQSAYHYASGPPCSTEYRDYSPLLQELLQHDEAS